MNEIERKYDGALCLTSGNIITITVSVNYFKRLVFYIYVWTSSIMNSVIFWIMHHRDALNPILPRHDTKISPCSGISILENKRLFISQSVKNRDIEDIWVFFR